MKTNKNARWLVTLGMIMVMLFPMIAGAEDAQTVTKADFTTVGNYVTFGHYEQDNNNANGPEPIEWLVLDYDEANNRLLLLSHYGLDAKWYNKEWLNISWETCSLRAWLNDYFLDVAFSAEEQSAILLTQIDNSKNQDFSGYKTHGSNITQDKIFLLSYAEAQLYLGAGHDIYTNTIARVAPTIYAKDKGAKTDVDYPTVDGIPASPWWLRSPGEYEHKAMRVEADGSVSSHINAYSDTAIRPALWLNLGTLSSVPLANNASNPKETILEISGVDTAMSDVVGAYVVFGHYEQDADFSNGPEPVEWLVLDYDVANKRILLLSRYGLDAKPYNQTRDSITWEQCTLRAWLNNEFLSAAFSVEEQSAILLTLVDNGKSQGFSGYDANDGGNTKDRIFLLSYAEANKYLSVTSEEGNVISRVAPTAYAIKNGSRTRIEYQTADGATAGWWWLRSLGGSKGYAAFVYSDGSIASSRMDEFRGIVRPAFWLNLNADIFQ